MHYKNGNRVAVLLATYNGGAYLQEQLNSILSQLIDSFYTLNIYIRDDGSTDNTLMLIQDMVSKYSNIYFMDDGLKLGARLSFAKLLSSVEADFYFLCDQDDVWHSDKVSISLKCISYYSVPALFFTDLNLVDEKGGSLGLSFWQHQKIKTYFFNNPNNFIYNSLVTGCSVVINKKLRDSFIKLTIPWDDIFYHDQMLSILAAKIGSINFSTSCTIDYRQHSNNAVGSSKFSLINKVRIGYLYLTKIDSLRVVLKWYNISFFRFVFGKFFLMLKRRM